MTMIRGVRILAAPCCGKRYAYPRYLSMNFMAHENWTDGWRVGSLMPNESSLRLCQCGEFVRLKDLVDIGEEESSALPRLEHIPVDRLPDCIERAKDDDMKISARLAYWREMNHAYRDVYRVHRDEEEARLQVAWELDQRKTRFWLKNLIRWPLPEYIRLGGTRITYPPFEPTPEQQRNMVLLVELLLSIQRDEPERHVMTMAELFRELGQFEEAEKQIAMLPENQRGVTSDLITRLINEKETALVRYRMW
jgi:hypothetical protein